MILSVSRRTDIPAFYSEWFYKRLEEGFLLVRNPMNPHQVSRIALSPDLVDGIVFWTKNPAPMLGRLGELADYPYYVQFTLNGYGREVEPGLPRQSERLSCFQEFSRRIGKERVIWRYDPIFLNGREDAGYGNGGRSLTRYSLEWHLRTFREMAGVLCGYTERVVISFLDFYVKTRRNMQGMEAREMENQEMLLLAEGIAEIAEENGMTVCTCAEEMELSHVGVEHGSCIDRRLFERIGGRELGGKKDRDQRGACGCLESIDVGTYHTCPGGCRYCYANFNEARVRGNAALYDKDSPILCGVLGPEDRITEREVKSLRL